MATIQIRDLPEAVYCKLKDGAKREHRSFAQQAVSVLEKGLSMDEDPKIRRRKILAALSLDVEMPDPDTLPDPAALIHEDRCR